MWFIFLMLTSLHGEILLSVLTDFLVVYNALY